jgi:hypothetical protein
LWHVDTLLDNDREINSHTENNGSVNNDRYPAMTDMGIPTDANTTKGLFFYAVRAEML